MILDFDNLCTSKVLVWLLISIRGLCKMKKKTLIAWLWCTGSENKSYSGDRFLASPIHLLASYPACSHTGDHPRQHKIPLSKSETLCKRSVPSGLLFGLLSKEMSRTYTAWWVVMAVHYRAHTWLGDAIHLTGVCRREKARAPHTENRDRIHTGKPQKCTIHPSISQPPTQLRVMETGSVSQGAKGSRLGMSRMGCPPITGHIRIMR